MNRRTTVFGRDRRVGFRRPNHVRGGVVGLAALVLLCVVGIGRGIPFWPSGKHEVWAQFSSAQSLRAGNPVRVAGVNVGKVGEVTRAQGDRGALVRLDLDPDQVDVHADARAGIYWRTLLGRNVYVELDPGSRGAPALEGRIESSRTTVQVELDEVLQPLQDEVREGAQQIVAGVDGGLAGEPAGAAFDALAKTARPIARGLPPLRGEAPGDLSRLIAQTSRWTTALAQQQRELAGLIDHTSTALAVTAARRADVGATLDTLPATLRTTRRTLSGLHETLPILDETADELRPGARRLARAADTTRPLLAAATPLLRQARPLLDRLDPALRGLRRLSPDLTATMRGLREPIKTTRDQIVPFLESKNEALDMKVYELIGPTLASSTGVMATSDANGTFVQFEAGGGEAAVPALPCKTLLTDPTDTRVAICQGVKTFLASILSPPGGQPEFGRDEDQSKDPAGGGR